MERFGYKAFNKGLVDMYGNKRELNHIYSVDGPIMWYSTHGGHGYHFCTYLEDCFSYFNGFNNEIDLAIVKGSGSIIQYDDDYRGNYEMFVSSSIEILKILKREEVIEYFLKRKNQIETITKFIYGFPLSIKEQELFLDSQIAKENIEKVYTKTINN